MSESTLGIRQHIGRMSAKADYFWSGAWWWSVRYWFAERSLSKALDQHGDNSIEARRYALRCDEFYFGVRYWRTSPPLVRGAVKAALLANKQYTSDWLTDGDLKPRIARHSGTQASFTFREERANPGHRVSPLI